MKTKLVLLTLAIFLVSILYVTAHEETTDCKVDIEKYTSEAKKFVNENQNEKNVKYGKRILGKNAKIEVKIDDEIWHANLVKGKVEEIAKGSIEKEDYNVYTTMCTLHDLEEGDLTAMQALKDKKITYKANGRFNKIKLGIISMFFK